MLNGKNEGIHTFLVKIREPDGKLSKGVWLEDLGSKIGLNGVDNARIRFDGLRAPKECILNRYSDIDD
jgi:acyl-CoA oxidase